MANNAISSDLDWIQLRNEMDSLGSGPSNQQYESLLIKKCKEAPYVPIGAFITLGILFRGLTYFAKGDSWGSQRMMRARCIAQGITIGLALMTMSKGAANSAKDDEEDE